MKLLVLIMDFFRGNSSKLFLWGVERKKHLQDRAVETNTIIKDQLFQLVPFLVASSMCGMAAYLYAVLFSQTEKLSLELIDQNRYYIFFLTPTAFLLSWWLVRRFAPYSGGSGIPQVMASIELVKPSSRKLIYKFMSVRNIIVKIASSIIGLFGGGVLGREGPTIQISSAIFVSFYKILPPWWKPVSQKNILIVGAASGLAAAFNTPLGGIIFAIEELSKFHIKYYKSTLFIAVIVAGLSTRALGGSYLYLGYPKLDPVSWMVVLGIILVSILAGYIGSKMCVLIFQFLQYVRSIKPTGKSVLIVILCAMTVAVPTFFFGTDVMGSGKELIVRVLFSADKHVDWYIPIVRFFGQIATFGFGGAGGIFAPSLSSGASVGAVVAHYLNLSGSDSNLLVIVGMTACLASVTRAPFTTAIIVFEMIDRHNAIFFLLLAAIIANMVGSLVDKKPLYDRLKENYIDAVKGTANNDRPPDKNASQ